MKKYFVYLFIIFFSISCNSNNNKIKKQDKGYFIGSPKIEIPQMDVNFGTIDEGVEIMIPFEVKNTGDAPLIIYDVQPSCGCTVSQFPRKPINPGDTAEIKLIFNSDGYSGYQIKTAKVFTNTKDSVITLTIEGNINTNY